MKSSIYRFLVVAIIALALVGGVGSTTAQASSLSSMQVSAIISLLQVFGADQSVINNVQSALGGSTTNTGLTCASFSDVTYGNFDNNPGGRVSQLQTWLGISATTFGFGTFGNRTQTLWNSKCGNTTVSPIVPPTTATTTPFSATPVAGTAPLTVLFSGVGKSINFGDTSVYTVDSATYTADSLAGAIEHLLDIHSSTSKTIGTITHTYTRPGTYTATTGEASITITVASSTSTTTVPTPTATIDQSSLTSTSVHPTITGSAQNVSIVGLSISNGGDKFDGTGTFAVSNGHWSVTLNNQTYTPGTYGIDVYDGSNNLLTHGTLTVTAPVASFSATPTSGVAPLTVSFSNAASILRYGDGHFTVASGSANAAVGSTTHTYTLAGTYVATSGDTSITITVASSTPIVPVIPAPSVTLSKSSTVIIFGTAVQLTWAATNATSCVGTNFNTSNKVSGSVSVSPTTTTVYSISCVGAGGSVSTSTIIQPPR